LATELLSVAVKLMCSKPTLSPRAMTGMQMYSPNWPDNSGS
jgi:hypothetical protein